MKLMDGFKLPGQGIITIPDCSRDDLPGFFKEMGYKIGAEIGVYKAMFTQKFCTAGLKMYAIDSYIVYPAFRHPRGQDRMDYLYKLARRGMKGYDCTFIRKFSMDAVQDFPDESLDFVYIDGCHQFRYIAEDIAEWSHKVRKGGIVSGHDYARFHPGGWAACQVAEVVDAYVKAFQIKRCYLLGNVKAKEGEKRDKYRSWMWVKE